MLVLALLHAHSNRCPMSAKTTIRPEQTSSARRRGSAGSQQVRVSSFAELLTVDPLARIALVRGGLPAVALQSAAELLSLSQVDLLTALRIPVSTFTAHMRERKPLSPDESDKLIRLAEVVKAAVVVFGDSDEGKAWVTDTILSLGGKRPVDLLDTQDGFTLVMQTLGRVQFGAPA